MDSPISINLIKLLKITIINKDNLESFVWKIEKKILKKSKFRDINTPDGCLWSRVAKNQVIFSSLYFVL